MPRDRSRSTDGGSVNQERLEPKLLRAAENDDVETLKEVIEAAKSKGQISDNFLRIGLLRSSEKGKINATQYLLNCGARSDGANGNRASPLMRAVEHNHIRIVQLLLDYGASPETADKKGRTALMTAAWKNHWHVLNLLIIKGANVNAKDSKQRNVLHNLAADKICDWGDSVIELLLKVNIHIDGEAGQDELKRSPLHWACATGKKRLAEQLLTRSKYPRANVNSVEIRSKTSLHIAAAHDRDDIVGLLLEHGANVHQISDGGWMALHNACLKGCAKIVRMLLDSGADVNSRLLNGKTALHIAAEEGHLDVVKCLLERKEIKRAARDTFGSTPFLRAAQNRRKDVVNLLAPSNNVNALSSDALGAANGFSATIVDFGNFRNENQVKKRTIYELLYGRDPKNSRKPAITVLPKDNKAADFRWIHLPANNMQWVEALLTKSFIEEGASDIEGFKALERSFTHQHRGQQVHSHFMRPLCHSTPRAPRIPDEEAQQSPTDQTPPTPTIVVNGNAQTPRTPEIPKRQGRAEYVRENQSTSSFSSSKPSNEKKEKRGSGKGSKPVKITHDTSKSDGKRKVSLPIESRSWRSPGSPGRKDPTQIAKGNIYTFMPYLHFETDAKRQEMQEAIKRATLLNGQQAVTKAKTTDEMLLRAHLATSTLSLHVRRTLDQYFYHNIDTQNRDRDQVVYRYQTRSAGGDNCDIDAKIYMVDQLFMYILGKDLIVTSFPQRWQQPRNDPLNVLDGIIEDINSKTRDPVRSVYDLALIITARCSGIFDRHRMGDGDYQFLDMFEASIGSATDKESKLFSDFNAASRQASEWLQRHRRPNRFFRQLESTSRKTQRAAGKEDHFKYDDPSYSPLFVDKLLDIGEETDLVRETKDIRDELSMIRKVLEDQATVLQDLEMAICDIFREEHRNQSDVKRRLREQQRTIEMHIKDIERMDKQAERIYSSITDLLDLKQKHANAFEARFARDQAAGTAKQSQTIMVFTIVTIIFLPLSFIAAFFTINIREFPRENDGSESLPLSYVSKYMFGIGFAISIPLVVIALQLDNIADLYHDVRRRVHERRKRATEKNCEPHQQNDLLKMENILSTNRKSVETDRIQNYLLPVTSRTSAPSVRKVENGGLITGFKMRNSRDIERGVP